VYNIKRKNLSDDVVSPMYYIGKKLFRRKNKTETDWRTYYGSSEWLQEDIKLFGKDAYEREILDICYSKSEMSYKEVMYQINLKTLKVNKNEIMQKKYYNLNIMGKYYTDKYFTKADKEKIKDYINTGKEDYEYISVTNGVDIKYINQLVYDIDLWLEKNPDYYIGRGVTSNKGCTLVTNGDKDIYVHSDDLHNFLNEYSDYYIGSSRRGKFVLCNNKISQKFVSIDEVDEFLEETPGWKIGSIDVPKKGYCRLYNIEANINMDVHNTNKDEYLLAGWSESNIKYDDQNIWINKGNFNKKIKLSELKEFEINGWERGRYNHYNKGKITINNGFQDKQIATSDKIPQGWYRGSVSKGKNKTKYGSKVYNTITKEIKYFKDTFDLEWFLKNNKEWSIGQGYSTSANTVFAIDMKTLKKVNVTSDEYKQNPYLTSLKTKKVKIKIKNRIVFKGYLDIYLEEHKDIPKSLFREALRSETGQLIKQKGKYAWVTDEKIFIVYL
jgi:hypothetical protein